MTSTPPPTPAGWYDDTADPTVQRYWDGSSWTAHTAPKAVGAPVPPRAGGISKTGKVLIIGGSVLAGLILVSGVAAAVGGGNREPIALSVEETIASTPTPTPTPTPTATPTPAPTVETVVVDVATFKSDAYRDLDDFEKDLNDMVVTVNEGGFWRLLTNTFELGFNLGQLQTNSPPPSVAVQWDAGLVTLDATISGISDAVATEDPGTILAAIEVARAQVNVLRGITDGAV